jgi:hypothetical protein
LDENLRTWVWFFSVVMAMTIGPALLGTLLIAGLMQSYRHYRDLAQEKLRPAHIAGAPILAYSRNSAS